MIRADIEEQGRLAKYCVRIDHRHEAVHTLVHELIRVTQRLDELERALSESRATSEFYLSRNRTEES